MKSVHSYEPQPPAKIEATRKTLDAAFELPGTPEGIRKAREVIQRSSGTRNDNMCKRAEN